MYRWMSATPFVCAASGFLSISQQKSTHFGAPAFMWLFWQCCLLPHALPAASVAPLLTARPGKEGSFILLCQANVRRGLALREMRWELCNNVWVSYKGNANSCECTHRGHNSQLREMLCCASLSGSDHSLVCLQCAEWLLPPGTTCLGTQCYKNAKFARLKAVMNKGESEEMLQCNLNGNWGSSSQMCY